MPGYLMDDSRHVVINTNDRDLLNYKSLIKQHLEMKSLQDELNSIKVLLKKLSKE